MVVCYYKKEKREKKECYVEDGVECVWYVW